MAQTQKAVNSPKSSKLCSVLRVDKDIDFVLDEDDVSYLASVPTQKTVENSRKSHSKKNAFNPCISFLEPVIENSNISEANKETCNLANSSDPNHAKSMLRKRKRELLSETPKKVIRKKLKNCNVPTSKILVKKNGSILAQSKPKPLKTSPNSSPDSDIEILEVKLCKSSNSRANLMSGKRPQNMRNGLLLKGKKKFSDEFLQRKSSMKPSSQNALKPCFPSSSEELINEADTAPIMDMGSIPDRSLNEASCSIVSRSSYRWLSANGTIDTVSCSNESSSNAKESPMKYNKKSDLLVPEMKLPQKNRSRELNNLYANLNEIAWAQERSFKRLLINKDEIRHSDRITVKNIKGEKNLRSITGTKTRLNKRDKNGKFMQRHKGKFIRSKPGLNVSSPLKGKNNLLICKMKKRHFETKNVVKQADKIKKRIYHGIKTKAKNEKNVSNITKPKLNHIVKATTVKEIDKKATNNLKVNLSELHKKNENLKGKKMRSNAAIERKNIGLKKKTRDFEKKDKNVLKVKFNGMKPKLSSTMKTKLLSSKMNKKPNTLLNSLASKKLVLPEASVSGLQNPNKKFTAAKTDESSAAINKTSIIQNALKKFEKIEISNEIELFRSIIGGDNGGDIFSALQRGSKLRVTLEPLEHTTHWNSDFYEAFKNQILEQALRKTLEKRNHQPISSMFQDLQNSIFNPPHNVKATKKKRSEEESVRSSVRQIEGSFRYKEIVVKKHKNYMQFVLVPNLSKKNCLSIEAMKELKEALLLAKKDPSCRAVLLNSSGPYFCTGIDLSQLIGDHRNRLAEEMACTIRDLVLTFGSFMKPVIAAVNGTAVGFGVSLLALCDVVLASDKATFSIPATRLGYIPEGAITLTLPQVIGAGVASEMLLQGRRFTAEQALRHGLVSEVMWPTQLMNEVVPRILSIAAQPLQVMEATKSMVRCHQWEKLPAHVEKEAHLLPSLWLDPNCQLNIKRTLQTGWLID